MAAAVIKRLQEPFPHLLVGRRFSSLFRASILGYDWRRSANSKGNRSSPLYAICLNWITFLQFVDFDSKLFYGRHCQIEPDGEHPTSRERFILPIKPARSREFNPFHRKHHQASNASSERRSNKTVFGWCFWCFASPFGKVLLLLSEEPQ